MKQIKVWAQEKSKNLEIYINLICLLELKPEDAFRVMDPDFDGFMSKEDLNRFLKEVIKLNKEEITTQRVDRLFKLLDVFKRGNIQFSDIKRFFEEDMDYGNNASISGGKKLIGRSTFDWRLHAKQQIGLILSKKFSSLSKSFEGKMIIHEHE